MKKILYYIVVLMLLSSNVWGATNWVATPSTIVLTATPGQTGIKQVVTIINSDSIPVTVTWNDSIDFFRGLIPGSILVVPANGLATYTMPVDLIGGSCLNGCPRVVGTYTGNVTLTGGGLTKVVPVTLTIAAIAATKPSKVLGLTVVSNTSAVIQWTPNTESDLAGYKVYARTGTGTYTTGTSTIGSTYTVTGLLSQTTYFFVVTAIDIAGNESGHSSEVSLTTF